MTHELKTAHNGAVRRCTNTFDASPLLGRGCPAGVVISAAVMPAIGQTVEPTATPAGSGAQSAASIPDFSGLWAHPYLWPGFEPPLIGSRPGGEQIAPEANFRRRRPALPPANAPSS